MDLEAMVYHTLWQYLKRTDCNLIHLGASVYCLERMGVNGSTPIMYGDLFECARTVHWVANVLHEWDPY